MYDYHFTVRTQPYEHQIDAFHKCYGKEAFALFMEQGTGKTKVAIDIACNLFQEKKINAVMVIAPNGVHSQWGHEEIPKHSSQTNNNIYIWNNKSTAGELKKRRAFFEAQGALKWFLVNVETFSTSTKLKLFQDFVKKHNVFLVIDEATRIKNPAANRTINIIYNLAECKKAGRKVTDVIPYSKYRAVLTGMMITNSPYDLWAMFEFLQHDYFDLNFYAFKARYGIEVRDSAPGTGQVFTRKIRQDEIDSIRKYALQGKHIETIAAVMKTSESSVQYILEHPNINMPYKRLDELKEKIQPLAYIVRKEDCLDLPPKVYERIYVNMNVEQKRIYNELKKQYITMYQEKDLTVQNKLTLVGRLQQITGGFFPYEENGKGKIVPIMSKNPKIEALKQDLEETGNEVIIIWARFVGELKMLYAELTKAFPNKNIELYYGGVSGTRRQIIMNAFKEGKVNILIANARTAGTGLNLQKAHLQYFFSNSYSLEDRAQAEDRSHRSGQTHSVLYKDIIMEGTVDMAVFEVLQTKKSLLDYFRNK